MLHTTNNDASNKDDSGTSDELNQAKISLLVTVLNDRFYGCDILLCLFIAAVQSYRVDRCLRPFPPMYTDEFNNKDIDKLRKLCSSIPPLENILKNPNVCSKEIIDFLLWLFNQNDQPLLKYINFNEVNLPDRVKKSLRPNYVFHITYPEKTESNWKQRKGKRNCFLSYHGSQLDNFYSILKVGLQQHFGVTKELLYGNGIYLTTEISLSMTYAPFAHSWTNSILGSRHSIIAVCEVIDDIDKVKCKDEKIKDRAMNRGSMSGSIPDKYFVVTDSDMVRLKYLFVYKKNTISSMRSWIYNNMAFILIAAYVVVLFSIGFFQGPTWTKLQKQFNRMLYSEQIINDTHS